MGSRSSKHATTGSLASCNTSWKGRFYMDVSIGFSSSPRGWILPHPQTIPREAEIPGILLIYLFTSWAICSDGQYCNSSLAFSSQRTSCNGILFPRYQPMKIQIIFQDMIYLSRILWPHHEKMNQETPKKGNKMEFTWQRTCFSGSIFNNNSTYFVWCSASAMCKGMLWTRANQKRRK